MSLRSFFRAFRAVRAAVALTVSLLMLVSVGQAAVAGVLWTVNGVTVSGAPGDQLSPVAVPDGLGGVIIAWEDRRSGTGSDVYAQKLNSSGVPQWTANGKVICNAGGDQVGVRAAPDGAGGAFLAWEDSRGGSGKVIYAQRIDSQGVMLWKSNGMALSDPGSSALGIANAGGGSAVVCWEHAGTSAVYANRVEGDVPSWGATGTLVSNGAGSQRLPVISHDGYGGAIVAFQDDRLGDEDVYANRIDSAGGYPWGADGVAVRTGAGFQGKPRIAVDGAGGAVVFWENAQAGSLEAGRLDSSGNLLWGDASDPAEVCSSGGPYLSYQIDAEGSGGGVFVWNDGRSGTRFDIYAQKLDASGAPQWALDGRLVRGGTGNKKNPQVVSAGWGETVICWSLEASGNNIYAQKLDPAGKLLWGSEGVPVCINSAVKSAPDISKDTKGGAFITWNDGRNGQENVYAQRVADDPPTIEYVIPDSGRAGTVVSIDEIAGTGFKAGASVRLSRAGMPDINAREVSVVSSTKITCKFDLEEAESGAWDLSVRNPDGQSVTLEEGFTVLPSSTPTWYLAEGSTAWGFDCYISIMNPSGRSVHVNITYMTAGGPWSGGTITMPPKSQFTVNPSETLGHQDFSTKIHCREGESICVDRTMSWEGGSGGVEGEEAHSSVGVTSASTTWYLPEGSSNWGFECWLLIQNPNSGEALCNVTYMIEGGHPVYAQKKVPANSRATFNIAEDIGAADASIRVISDRPVIPERAMYRNERREGHDSIGTTTAQQQFFLAEGSSAWGFTTYVLIQNPNDEQADVTVVYMTSDGPRAQAPFTMPANSRKTIRVNDVLPDKDFSTWISGNKEIIAERAMYWHQGADEICHDSIGMSAPHQRFYLPDGQTDDGRETWTMVQNPNSREVKVCVTYLTPDGFNNVSFDEIIPPNSRRTYNMADSWVDGRAAVLVYSKTEGSKIVVERAMYWNSRGAGTETIGGYSD